MTELGAVREDRRGSAAASERRASIWPHVEERVVDLVEQHRSTIVFANSRRLAERLTARLNEIATERADGRARPRPGLGPRGSAVRRDHGAVGPVEAPPRSSPGPTTARCPRSSAP